MEQVSVVLQAAGPFADFQVADIGTVDGEADGGADVVKAVDAGGSGVDVEQVVFAVRHHLEDVGMSADEDAGTELVDFQSSFRLVSPGVTADVGHQDADIFTNEALELRVDQP